MTIDEVVSQKRRAHNLKVRLRKQIRKQRVGSGLVVGSPCTEDGFDLHIIAKFICLQNIRPIRCVKEKLCCRQFAPSAEK